MLTMLMLTACHSGAQVNLDSGAPVMAATVDVSAIYDRLSTLEAKVADDEAAIEALQATVDDEATRLDAAESAIVALENGDGGSGSGAAVTFTGISEGLSYGGSGSSWEPITTSDVTVSATAGATIVAWCSLTNGTGGSPEYRLMINSDDGSYTNDAETVGDNAYATLLYGGENLTAWGFWTVPAAGDYTIQCQGRYASAYDVTFAAMVLG